MNSFDVKVPEEAGQLNLIISRGGYRQGSGRKRIGVTKTIKLTLSEEDWNLISQCGESSSEAIRNIIGTYKSGL